MPEKLRRKLWNELGCRYAFEEKSGVQDLSGRDPISWPADVHWVMHSSGSTGLPKAIPLTYAAVEKNAKDVMAFLNLGSDLIHLGSMSACYTNGLFNSFLVPILTGGKTLIGPVFSILKLSAYL